MGRFNEAQRRYNKRVLGLSVVYAAALLGAVWVFKHQAPQGIVAFALALLPALPILGIFWAMARYLAEEQDEYLRVVQIQNSLAATGLMLAATTVWGFLQTFELLPRVDFYWAAVIWFAGLGAASCWRAIRR
jgi:hypothetical protein